MIKFIVSHRSLAYVLIPILEIRPVWKSEKGWKLRPCILTNIVVSFLHCCLTRLTDLGVWCIGPLPLSKQVQVVVVPKFKLTDEPFPFWRTLYERAATLQIVADFADFQYA